jgi:chromosomal replication initiation ATPase DnaA
MSVLSTLIERHLVQVLDKVCKAHHVTRAEVCSRARSQRVAVARHQLWWELYNQARPFSYAELGRMFERNHTTVMHGVRMWEAALDGVPFRRAA